MIDISLTVILAVVSLYMIIPDLLLHRLGIGSWKRQYNPGVSITFDDGPNPEFTPRILDILDKHQVSATFFVVAENALKYPEIVKQIRERGHIIGAHSKYHRYAWFMFPLETWREWEECIEILENLTGDKIEWIRPPWGIFNLVSWWWMKTKNKQAILWNVAGHDWKLRSNEEQIVLRILSKTKEGSIILLHDSGGEAGAPENTVRALDIICHKIVKEQKLPLIQLSFPDWSLKWLVLSLWGKWEHLFARLYGVDRIDCENVVRLSRIRYKGTHLYDIDGQLLAKTGDWVGEIHLDIAKKIIS